MILITMPSLNEWPVAACRLILLASPLFVAVHTLGTQNALALSVIMVVWALPLGSAMDRTREAPVHFGQEACMILLVSIKTLAVMSYANATQEETLWLFPLLAYAAFAALTHWDSDKLEAERKNGRAWHAIQLAVVGLFGMADAAFLADSQEGMLISTADAVVSMVLLVVASDAHATLAWLFLQACSVPLLESDVRQPLRIISLLMVFISLLAMTRTTGNFIKHLLVTLIDWVKTILGWQLMYQCSALVSIAVIASTLRQPWYTARVTLPDSLVSFCSGALTFVDDVVAEFYKFTSRDDFQHLIALAAPEIAALRGVIFRVVATVYGPLKMGRDGKSFTMIPADNLLPLLIFAIGPLLLVLAIVVQVFPSGQAFVRSRWTWAWGLLSTLLFVGASQLAVGAPVSLLHFIFADSTYAREYTQAGQYALLAQLVLCASCICLFVATSLAESDEVTVVRRTGAHMPRLVTQTKEALRGLVAYITAPPLILLFLAVSLLVITITSTGSPLKSFDVAKIDDGRPKWLVSTPIDKVGAFASSLVTMLNPEVRLALIGQALLVFAMEQLRCWTCLCLDIPTPEEVGDWFVDAGSSIKSGLGFRRRRLLEYLPPSNSTRIVMTSRRLLSDPNLFGIACNDQDACAHTKICVADVLSDALEKMSDLVLDGLKYAGDFIANEIISRIPFLSVLDNLLKLLPRLDDLLHFDLFDISYGVSFSFSMELWGLDLGLLPNFKLPSLPSTPAAGDIAIVVLTFVAVAVVTYQLGLLIPAIQASIMTLELTLVAGAVALIASMVVFAFLLRDELRTYGYVLKIELAGNAYLYGIALTLLACAAMLKVGEASAQDIQRLRLLTAQKLRPFEQRRLLSPVRARSS